MVHSRDFGHKILTNGWEISQQCFKIVGLPGIPPGHLAPAASGG